jgi:hypothetical protein
MLTAHDFLPGEVLRDCRAVHTILLSEIADAETSEVIIDELVCFRGGEKGLRFPNPPDSGPSSVPNRGVIDPLRHPVYPSFPA